MMFLFMTDNFYTEFLTLICFLLFLITSFININNKESINIHKYYTVTDKADGERHLLYIANNGKVYLIDINLNIKFKF